MSLEEKQLDLSIKLVTRAMRAMPAASPGSRMEALRSAYDRLATLDAGDDEWTEDTLDAAWALVESAFPKGGEVLTIIDEMVEVHQGIVEMAVAPADGLRKRPRRDA
jgi:hypothetical protein